MKCTQRIWRAVFFLCGVFLLIGICISNKMWMGSNFSTEEITSQTTVIRADFEMEERNSDLTLLFCITEYEGRIDDDTDALNMDVLSEVIDFQKIISEERFEVCGYPCGIFHGEEISYACWTTSPEASGIMEYDPSCISKEEVMKVIESVYKQPES